VLWLVTSGITSVLSLLLLLTCWVLVLCSSQLAAGQLLLDYAPCFWTYVRDMWQVCC
jgi:hypothetical protein